MRVSWCVVVGLLGIAASVGAQPAAATCGAAALPGLAAARMRLRPATPEPDTIVLTALRAASVDEFLRIAAAITGRPPTDPVIDALVRAPVTAVPCTAAVIARDRLTYSLLLSGYSAREIADIVSGRLSKRELDDAQRLLMTGQGEAVVAAFLDRAMAARQQRALQGQRRTTRRVATPSGRTPSRTAPPRPPVAPRQRSVTPPATVVAFDLPSAIVRFARQYQVDPALVLAMIDAESGGVADAVSHKGALGLMQLMPATARMLGVDPSDPEDNLRGGVAYIAGLIQQFGNTREALIAYNAGPSHAERVRKGLAVLYGETRKYLDTIGRRYPL